MAVLDLPVLSKNHLTRAGQQWLEAALADREMSITDLAEKVGMSRKHASQLVGGHAPISVEMADRLARAVGVSAGILRSLRDDGRAVPPRPSFPIGGLPVMVSEGVDLTTPMTGWEFGEDGR